MAGLFGVLAEANLDHLYDDLKARGVFTVDSLSSLDVEAFIRSDDVYLDDADERDRLRDLVQAHRPQAAAPARLARKVSTASTHSASKPSSSSRAASAASTRTTGASKASSSSTTSSTAATFSSASATAIASSSSSTRSSSKRPAPKHSNGPPTATPTPTATPNRGTASFSLSASDRIRVCVRKRPLHANETDAGQIDILSVDSRGSLRVFEPKVAVDLRSFTQSHAFHFDEAIDADQSNAQVYVRTAAPLVRRVLEDGYKATCFAYGQTGSGKTHTMMGVRGGTDPGLYVLAAQDVFAGLASIALAQRPQVLCSFYEIYCGQLYDLLNSREKLHAREDAHRRVIVQGLRATPVGNTADLMALVSHGLESRSVGKTGANADSSRSHAILQLELRMPTGAALATPSEVIAANVARVAAASAASARQKTGKGGGGGGTSTPKGSMPSSRQRGAATPVTTGGSHVRTRGGARSGVTSPSPGTSARASALGAFKGRLVFIDLAGSERAADTTGNDRQTRNEGAEINTSLLALKECIRALDQSSRHTPFRQSKLTQVLKDSLVGAKCCTCMIANVSPNQLSSEHTLNTLRYADRVKELKKTNDPTATQSDDVSKVVEPSVPPQHQPGTPSTPGTSDIHGEAPAPATPDSPLQAQSLDMSTADSVTLTPTPHSFLKDELPPASLPTITTPSLTTDDHHRLLQAHEHLLRVLDEITGQELVLARNMDNGRLPSTADFVAQLVPLLDRKIAALQRTRRRLLETCPE